MSEAINAFGTILRLGDGEAVESFAAISEPKDISGPGTTQDSIEVTNHGSPNRYREHLPSLKDGGTVSFELNYNPADPTHDVSTGILSVLEEGRIANWELIWPDEDGNGLEFAGFPTQFEWSSPVEGARTASVEIKVTGAVAPIVAASS